MTATAPTMQWTTPSGTLAIDERGVVTALVSTTLRTEEVVAASVKALAELRRAPFAEMADVQRSELGYGLTWPGPAGRRQPLAHLVAHWRGEPGAHVAEAIEVALTVSRALGELDHLTPHAYLLSPAQVFLETGEDGRQRWVVIPLPIDAVPFKELVVSSPEMTMWLSGDNLVRRGGNDRAYMVAAALYYALVGDLYAADFSPMRRLQRHIAHHAGNRAALRAMLTAAIPASLAQSARRLGDFILESLGPNFGRPMTVPQSHAVLNRLEGELSAPLLAGGWETAGRPDWALAILETQARRAPRDEVPWQTLQRLRTHQGAPPREDGSEELELAPIPASKPDTPIGRIRTILEQGPEARDLLAATLNAMIEPGGPELADDERLFIVYAAARWIGAGGRVVSLLARPCTAQWDAVVRALLLARIHSDQQAWAQVARDCRECLSEIGRMPANGGERGAYVSAFALLLDAGAHIGFVAAGHAADYLEDAWTKLERARRASAGLRALSLDEAIGQQLNVLRDQVLRVPRLGRLLAQIEDVRTQVRIVAANDAASPPLPWPEERWVFA